MKSFQPLGALAALALLPTALAWYEQQPACSSAVTPFTYNGCYDNGLPGQPLALDLKLDWDDSTGTLEKCWALCKGEFSPPRSDLESLSMSGYS